MKPIEKGRHVYIRSVCDEDFSFLHGIFSDTDELYLWSNLREGKPFSEFSRELSLMLKNTYRHFYIICDSESYRKIGFIFCYNAHSADGYAYTTAYIIPEYRDSFYGAEAGLLYYSHLFRYFNYRKLYSEIYSYNNISKEFLESAGFCIEGVLKQHRYYENAFHDLYIYCTYRDEFLERFSFIEEQIRQKEEKGHD